MNDRRRLGFHEASATFHGPTQNARVLTEKWAEKFLYCMDCPSLSLNSLPNNMPVADFECPSCGEQYELKSQHAPFRRKVLDGAYNTMIERLNSNENPNLILLRYSKTELCAEDMWVVPKHFFIPQIIEKRKPLAPTARRAGWVGCNILLEGIPEAGKIPIVTSQSIRSPYDVRADWQRSKVFSEAQLEARGWLLLTFRIVEALASNEFLLSDVYSLEHLAREQFPNNQHVRPKLRQQLQKLRDRGLIEFLGAGRYRRL